MSCKPACKLCDKLRISQSITVVTVDGVDTLVIDLPLGVYGDGCKYCIVLAQAIPETATINMPVAFSINGDTTVVYPFVRCDCAQVTVCAIRTRTRYATRVSTNATSGVFKSLGGLSCAPNNVLPSLPAPAAAATPGTFALRATDTPVKVTKTKTTTTKEVLSHE